MLGKWISAVFGCLLALVFWVAAIPAFGAEDMSLEKAAQKSNNPVSDAWLLITQNDYTVLEGDATGGGSEMRERFSFQPVTLIRFL